MISLELAHTLDLRSFSKTLRDPMRLATRGAVVSNSSLWANHLNQSPRPPFFLTLSCCSFYLRSFLCFTVPSLNQRILSHLDSCCKIFLTRNQELAHYWWVRADLLSAQSPFGNTTTPLKKQQKAIIMRLHLGIQLL